MDLVNLTTSPPNIPYLTGFTICSLLLTRSLKGSIPYGVLTLQDTSNPYITGIIPCFACRALNIPLHLFF